MKRNSDLGRIEEEGTCEWVGWVNVHVGALQREQTCKLSYSARCAHQGGCTLS
jgi:hypothetical protein